MNPTPPSPSEGEPAVDKVMTETGNQPVVSVDPTPSVAIEQKEDAPTEGAAKQAEPSEAEKKAEASGVASPVPTPALDPSGSPSKAERHVPYAPPHRRRNANEDSRDEASGGEGAPATEEATAAAKPVQGQGEEAPPRKTKDKQFKKDKGPGFQKDKPRVEPRAEGEKGGKEDEAAPMPKRERKVRPVNREASDAPPPSSTNAATTHPTTAPTAAMPKREATQDARQEGGRFGKEGRPERPEKKGWNNKAPAEGNGQAGSGAGWKKRGEGEQAEGSGPKGGKRREEDDVLIVFDVSMGEHQSHRVEYRKGQDFTEVIRNFCQQNNLSADYAPRLEAYLRARAPPGVFPPKTRVPSRPAPQTTEAPQAPATQQPTQGPPPSQGQAPFGRQDVRFAGNKGQQGGKGPMRDGGAKENQAQFGNATANGQAPAGISKAPQQDGEGGKPMARGRSKERGVNRQQGEGAEGPPKRAGSKVRQNSRGPPAPKPPTSVDEFLVSVEASAGLRALFKGEGFVHMDSLLELARDKRDFKEQMMEWGLKSGQAYDLLAKIRPFLNSA